MVHYYFIDNSQTMYTSTEKIDQYNLHIWGFKEKKCSKGAHNFSKKKKNNNNKIIYLSIILDIFFISLLQPFLTQSLSRLLYTDEYRTYYNVVLM